MCAAEGPQLFTIDDDGYTSLGEVEVPVGLEAVALRGMAACPERAITIED
jgi:ferredoxin